MITNCKYHFEFEITRIYKKILVVGLCASSLFQVCSCEKIVEVNSPTTALTSDNVYTNDATAAAVLTGLYDALAGDNPLNGVTINSISLTCGLSADELSLFGGTANANSMLTQYYFNKLTSTTTTGGSTLWNDLYSKIYIVNLALERLQVSTSLNVVVKQQLMGEAQFLRAFLYFYLVNLYGNVPLAISSDYRINSGLARTSVIEVYQQIISDLKNAQNLLSEYYVSGDAKSITTEKLRPNKWAATALLARCYLSIKDWANAEIQASSLLNSGKYHLSNLSSVFLKNSDEAIWQLQPVRTGWNTEEAKVFVLPSTGPDTRTYPVYLSSRLLNSFEAGDQRKMSWIGTVNVATSSGAVTYSYPNKYKSAILNSPVTEYQMVLRLSEQFLIRAEARAQLDKIIEATSDLNVIRVRASLNDMAIPDKASLLNAILHERQTELFTEWGHRWLDLKRTLTIDGVMNVVASEKGTIWNSNYQWYPLPLYDINQDPNLTQNLGY
jgi:hypothetical protein